MTVRLAECWKTAEASKFDKTFEPRIFENYCQIEGQIQIFNRGKELESLLLQIIYNGDIFY